MTRALALPESQARALLRAAEKERGIVEFSVKLSVLYAAKLCYDFRKITEIFLMPKTALPLPLDVLRKSFAYEPVSGRLYTISNGVLRAVGRLDAQGYLSVDVRVGATLRTILAHRIAYALMTGRDIAPGMYVDHINQRKDDNRWANLREVTHQQNMMNVEQPRGNDLPRGVYLNPKSRINPYKSKIQIHGKAIYIGSFPTIEAAKKAYDLERAKHAGALYG